MKFLSKLLLLTLFIPGLASAHTGVGPATGFMHGLQHPFGGLDHLLAMLAVGIWAAQTGHRMRWALPGVFIFALVIGGSLDFRFASFNIPFVEQGILASLLILGALIATQYTLPSFYSISIVSVFALFHGYAHGAEMPSDMGALSYTLGFTLSAILIIGCGVALSDLSRKRQYPSLTRIVGSIIGLSSIYLSLA